MPGFVRREPCDGVGNVLGLADLVGQAAHEERAERVAVLLYESVHVVDLHACLDAVGVDGVDADVVRAQFHREGLGESVTPCLLAT